MIAAASRTPASASRSTYDAVVIGAGIAGTLAARGLALRGRSVLLVEAKRFPRDKVCGCCLNARGKDVLERLGLLDSVRELGGCSVEQLRLAIGGRRHVWPIAPMLATSRGALDELLFDAAAAAGAECVDGCRARVLPSSDSEPGPLHRLVALEGAGGRREVACRLVISADGLTHSSLAALTEFDYRVAAGSRVGLQCILDPPLSGPGDYPAGELTMAVGRGGYVGVTAVEGGRLDVAAAVDAAALAAGSRPADIVRKVLRECGLPVPSGLDSARWRGTPPLTRRAGRVAGDRILLVGDSLGYVEPFTGEGMSWAAAAAEAAVPLADRAIDGWSPELAGRWESILRRKVFRHQWMCQVTSRLTRSPRAAAWAAAVCERVPPLRRRAVRVCGGGRPAASPG